VFPHSLGIFYASVTQWLGFPKYGDEGKVMGLAPYGKPKRVEEARRLVRLADDGSFDLDLKYFGHIGSNRRAFTAEFERLFGRPARHPEADLEPFHEDVAASGQKVLEEAVLHAARHALKRTGLKRLCMAGGVALNGVANWRILRETGCEELFVQPAAGDDGGALGAALDIAASVGNDPRPARLVSAALGPSYDDAACAGALEAKGYAPRRLAEAEMICEVARLVADGKVVGWFDGRMEFGPRALGHRSILADPTNPRMKEIVNARVKFREHFRPFAPSVALEDASTYFETPPGFEAPFMVLVCPVREGQRERLPAITHVDGSARIQTVKAKDEPRYHTLLKEFERLRGVPVLMNTSFNVKGEPIVCTPADALRTFEGCGLDALALCSYLVIGKRVSEPLGSQAGLTRSAM
ncbi:MAG: hypothetical protein HY608_08850, partial [Planctomycetes bacterium]|nr:hypothetical protein [Planctomycetota bacterium]